MSINNSSALAAAAAAAEKARQIAEANARRAAEAARKAQEEAARKAAAEHAKQGAAKTGPLGGAVGDAAKLGGGAGTSKIGLDKSGNTGRLNEAPPQNTLDEAHEEASAIFDGKVSQPDSDYRHIEHDAKDINATPSAEDAKKTRSLIEQNATLEKEALKDLSTEDRAKYDTLTKTLDSDPEARLSLQMLAIDKKLTGGPADKDGKNLLANLDALRTSPKADGLEGNKVLAQVVQEIQTPDGINQHNRGTCTMASTQILMALKQPAEYTRLITGLSSPEGKVSLANGDSVTRFEGTNKPDDTSRTDSARMFQATMMDYANGGEKYKNTAEAGGLNAGEVNRALEGLFAQNVNSQRVEDGVGGFIRSIRGDVTHDRGGAVKTVEEQANGGSPTLVGMNWGERDESGKTHGGHEILVTKVEGDRVYYDNPWGSQESMPKSEFEKRLTSYHEFDSGKLGQPKEDKSLVRNVAETTVNVVTAPARGAVSVVKGIFGG